LVHDEYDNLSYIINRARYYGFTNVSPMLIWKLTPWSWMADWFGNVRQVIEHVLSGVNDNMVARYAYVSSHLVRKVRHHAYIFAYGGTRSMGFTQYVEIKNRDKASPFGFGLSAADLSNTQLGILAALGITRVF